YYILVWKVGGADPTAGNTAVQLRLTYQPPPANDACNVATPLSLDTPLTGSTVHAFDDYELSGSSCFARTGQRVSPASRPAVAHLFRAPPAGRDSSLVANNDRTSRPFHSAPGTRRSGPPPNSVTTCPGAGNRPSAGTAEEVMCVPRAGGPPVYAPVDESARTA